MYPTLTFSRGTSSIELSTGNGFTVLPGVEGFDTPPVALSESEPADFDGALVTNVRYLPREVFVPLLVQGSDASEVRRRVRDLVGLLNPQLGAVTLSVAHAPSTSAELLSASAVDGVSTNFDAVAGSVSTETVVKRSGANSLKLTSGVPVSSARLKAANRADVVAAGTYRFSVWFRNVNTAGAQGLVALEFYNSGGSLMATQWSELKAGATSSWTNVAVDGVAPKGAVKVGGRVWSVDETYWDDFSLTEQSTVRQIDGYLSEPSGSALDATESNGWRRLGLTLRCPDPFWLGAQDAASLFDPSSTGGLGALPNKVTAVRIAGDAAVYPTITVVTGSDTDFTTAIGLSTVNSENLALASSAFGVSHKAANTVTIETNPRFLSATLVDGSSAWSWLTEVVSKPVDLFQIPPGDWFLVASESEPPGLTTTTAKVAMSWRSRWLTAW